MKNLKHCIVLFIFIAFIQNSYAQALSGIKTIGGTSPNYATLSLAIKDVSAKGVNGKLTFKIRSGTYTEKNTIGSIPGASILNDISFESETGKTTDVIVNFAGANTWGTHGTINLIGAEFINFRNLTIKSGAPEIASCVQLKKGCNKISFDNCKFEITTDDSGGLSACIAASDSVSCPTSIVMEGANAESLSITNCTFTNGSYGVLIAGKVVKGENIIEKCSFTNQVNYGIYLSGNRNNLVNKNSIIMDPNGVGMYGMYFSSVDSTIISKNYIKSADQYGMYFSYCNRNQIENNFLAGAYARRGTVGYCIYLYGDYNKFYHNSAIYDASSGTATGLLSAVVYMEGFSNEFLNNNFVNTGGGYVYFVGGGKEYFSLSNNNNLYASSGGFISHFTNPVGDYNFDQHKTYTKQDVNSVNILPKFMANFDLHIKVDNFNKVLDGTAAPGLGVSTDYDGQDRNFTKPDIGADEFSLDLYDFSLLDISPKKAIFGQNKVQVTIGNNGINSLVDSFVNLSYSTDGGLSWSANEKFTAKKLIKFGDQEIFEFSNPWDVSEFKTYTLKVKIEPSLKSDKVKINDSLSVTSCVVIGEGTYDLGPNAPVFKNLNSTIYTLTSNCGIDGPVVFNLESGTYTETMVMGFVSGTSKTNTITFQAKSGNPDDVIIKGGGNSDFNHYVFRFKTAKNIILKNLTIKNEGKDFASGVNLISASSGIIVDNCKFIMEPGLKNTYLYGVLLSGIEDINSKSSCEDVQIINSTFEGGNVGIKFQADSFSNLNGTEFINNTMSNVSDYGIHSVGAKIKTIKGNSITLNENSENSQGIFIFNSKNSNLTIDANKLINGGMYLSNLKSEELGKIIVSNNMLAGESKNTQWNDLFFTNLCENLVIYHNSLSFKNDVNTNVGAALHIESGQFVDVLNNIFFSNSNAYTLKVDDPNAVYSIDNNNYFTTGNKFAFWNGDANSLSELQSKSGKNESAISVAPEFKSLIDLHTLNSKLDSKGVSLADVVVDIDGQPRNANTPDLGCDEFTIGTDASFNKWIRPINNSAFKPNNPIALEIEIGNAGSTVITALELTITANGNNLFTENVSGINLEPSASLNYICSNNWTPIDTAIYTLCAKIKATGDQNPINDEQCVLVDINSSVGMNTIKNKSEGVNVFPNPFKDFIDLNSTDKNLSTLIIYDVLGNLVFEKKLKSTTEKINLTNLSKGSYLLKYGEFKKVIVKF